ncbi:MAG: hypothetical protein JSS72_07445 [Armatimonadetes bacterium]|nr:hypothetical protein [Armatimonadota bacterium]
MNSLILFALAAAFPQDSVDGRYEGVMRMPMIDQTVVLDIDHGPKGEARGSIILPGLNVKGAPAAKVTVADGKVHWEFPDVLGGLVIESTLTNSGLDGEFKQGGNSATFHLERTGAAQVDLPPTPTPVSDDLVGTWKGEYTIGYLRHFTLVLKNEGGVAVADLTIEGKKVTKVPVDRIRDVGGYLTIQSAPFGMTIEGPHKKGVDEFKLTISYAGFDVPFMVHREKGGK